MGRMKEQLYDILEILDQKRKEAEESRTDPRFNTAVKFSYYKGLLDMAQEITGMGIVFREGHHEIDYDRIIRSS